jgi:hypothetical protein
LYKPTDLHITHICIDAVGPQLIHKALLETHALRVRLRDMKLDGWHFITSRMIAASVAASHEEQEGYPQTGLMVAKTNTKSHLLQPAQHESKLLLHMWLEGNSPNIRVGFMKSSPAILGQLTVNPGVVNEMRGTGLMAIEVHYRRGLASRIKVHSSRGEQHADTDLCTLFHQVAQTSDKMPLMRKAAAKTEELQAAGGGQLVQAFASGSSNPAATGEAMAAKRQRQETAMTDSPASEAYAKKQARAHSSYLLLASASYFHRPEDYYDSFMGAWTPPEQRIVFDGDHKFKLYQGTSLVPRLAVPQKTGTPKTQQ